MMMMMMLMYFCGLMVMYNLMNLKILLSNFIFMIMIYLLMNYLSLEWFFISLNFSLSFYSYMLILMSLWISGVIIMILCSKFCVNLYMILLMILLMLFGSMNILMFYFLFEFSLIIVYLVILKWGMGFMRNLAGYYFMFYTLFFSIPLLIYIFYVIYEEKIYLMSLMEIIGYKINMYMYMYMLLAFLIKIPMFVLHGWLLKAHVEAPVFGSMILAAVLLKLGTYGLLRVMTMLYLNMIELNLFILLFSLIGSLYISVICLFQVDMKILVAYSSVVHMGLLLSSMMSMMKMGFIGGYMMMIAHGLCSSGLFYLVNLCYNESGSRLMLINKGMINYNSILSMFWFLLCSSNMSAPVSLNLIGEIFMMMILIEWYMYLYLYLMLFCLISFSYSLYLFCYIQHGDKNFYLKIKGSMMLDYMVLLMHWIPLNLMFLFLYFFN